MPQEPKEGAEQDHDYIHDNSSPEEIANVMAFLASDLSTAINAQVIVVRFPFIIPLAGLLTLRTWTLAG